ncbi:MAG: ammonium transporter [Candidatus Sumerlaeia bacterium]
MNPFRLIESRVRVVLAGVLLAPIAGLAAAQVEAPAAVSAADTAWVLISAALVLFMTFGLAFFYGGLVRKKNTLSVLMQCAMIICLITVQWVAIGYSLSFGEDVGGLIGGLELAGLRGVGSEVKAGLTIPHSAFMIFQMMFALITPALMIGAFAERMKFTAFCIFMVLWATLVYDPVAHWVWGGGFLGRLGALDFAGGTVVHISAGVSALAAALILGRRRGYPDKISPPHNLPLALLGAGMLWFGWFGFNAGSALAADGLAVQAFVVTHVAAAVGGLTWSVLDWAFHERPTVLGMITGMVAGLVAITPAAGFVNIMGALAIGFGAGVFCYLAVAFVKARMGYDDSLDVFGVHGVGGVWGALATGLFATTSVNPAGADGLMFGNPRQFVIQALTVAVTIVFAFGMTVVILKAIGAVAQLRATLEEERLGLDLVEHREVSYTLVD